MDRGGPNLVAYEYTGELMTHRATNPARNAMPSGAFPCKDGFVSITGQPPFWPRLCRMIDRPELATDPGYTARLDDPAFQPEVIALVTGWLRDVTKQDAMLKAQAEGMPLSALNTMRDVFEDPHLRARDFFERPQQPAAGAVVLPGLPIRMSDTPGELRAAPTLGQHTIEVLTAELGYSKPEVVILRQRNIV